MCPEGGDTRQRTSRGQSWRPKITRSPDAPGGQGRAGGNPRNLHSCLHSFTFLKFKLLIYNYLQAELKDSKSGALHWACGFKSHLRHQPSRFEIPLAVEIPLSGGRNPTP